MKRIFQFCIAILLLSGCVESPTSTSSSSSVLMPLKIGNQWIGRTASDSAGSTVYTYDTLTIVEEVVKEGETWYKANTGELFMNRENVGLLHAENDSSDGCGCAIAEFPAERGDTMMLPDMSVLLPNQTQPVDQVIGREVLSTDTSITVPAGTYSCYHYEVKVYSPANARLLFPDERYYKPDLGPVVLISSKGRWELVQVTLK